MKPKARFFIWIIRIVGAFILTMGTYSPALAEDLPDLVVGQQHAVGGFAQGDNDRVYTITVTNSGQVPTLGEITLTDTLPTGLIAQSISGSGWTCPTGDISALTILTCTRSTPLEATPSPASSSTITLTVDVAYNAATASASEDPGNPGVFYGTLTNSVNVTGGGDGDPSNIDNEVTPILMKPDLRVIDFELRNAANADVITNPVPNESFYIRMTIENRGGGDTGNFYPGVFLDNKPNYGPDHDEPGASPLPLNLGDPTLFSDYHITTGESHNTRAGCMYYNPYSIGHLNYVDEKLVDVNTERGNYTRPQFIPKLEKGSSTTADVLIAYPTDPYGNPIYDTDNVRNGLKAGSYNIYLYADPNCLVNESYEDNNSFLPIPLNVVDTIPPSVISSIRVNPSTTSLSNVGFTVTFSEIVTGVDTPDFALATTGVSSAQITGVSDMGGGVYTVSVYTGSGNGTIRLTVVDDNSIVDGSSNPLGGGAVGDGSFAGETYTISKVGADTAGVFRPSNGLLYLKNTNATGFADIAINYGIASDYPVAGDWDGNGTATIGIYRNGSFYLRNENTLGFADLAFAFGTPGDQPIAGDWDGDGIDTIGIFRTSTGEFQLRNSNSSGPADMSFYLGNVGDIGIAGDWNGDGMDTTGVFRPSNGVIFMKNTNVTGFADIAINYGLGGDLPVTGDWNNDGVDTIGVYRNAQFLLRNSNTLGFADIVFALGNPGDMPIAGNWDGSIP